MKSYSLTDVCHLQLEVFEQAIIEPVIVTQQSRPSHVLMSFETYEKLVERVTELEDLIWAEKAQENINNSSFVGQEKFTVELQRFANG